ncbi:MAG TPA: PTS sugar transporter subunit IIA [Casimicrobiaceae bacterium]|nr:PTS sugar transporter subunit IIA [Casimicrobiaceae bacterium]
MNPLCELLGTEDILLDLDVRNKDELLQRVSELLARRHGLSSAFVLESLKAREALGSTALGYGVAIPHARIGTIPSALALFVRTRTPIPFDAPDGKPVSNVLTLLVPRQANERHLQLLAGAATLLSDSNFRAELSQCKTAGAVRWLFARWPESPGKGATTSNG